MSEVFLTLPGQYSTPELPWPGGGEAWSEETQEAEGRLGSLLQGSSPADAQHPVVLAKAMGLSGLENGTKPLRTVFSSN